MNSDFLILAATRRRRFLVFASTTCVFFTLVALLSLQAAGTDERCEFNCYHKDKRYKFVITPKMQDSCPKWDPKREKRPPFSASTAFKKASKFISSIDPGKGQYWQTPEIALVDVYGWLWRVRFQLWSQLGWDGPPQYMDCYVLMDGTVVKPSISTVRNTAYSPGGNF
jgi:hypothetical protein